MGGIRVDKIGDDGNTRYIDNELCGRHSCMVCLARGCICMGGIMWCVEGRSEDEKG